MKYVVVRCDDDVPVSRDVPALLEGAKASFLQHLAQTGAAGLVRAATQQGSGSRSAHAPFDRFEFHRALFGLRPHEDRAAPGHCYLASIQSQLAPEETAWCCDLVTRQGDLIVDPTAGGIPTKESEMLLHALDEQLGSERQRWEIGQNARHLMIVSAHALSDIPQFGPPAPALLVGQPWSRSLPKAEAGEAFRTLIENASRVLERHVVNRVRIDLGENPANMIWLWGGATPQTQRTFAEQTGLSGALLSSDFLMRGFARVVDLDWHEAAARSLDEPAIHDLRRRMEALIDRRDMVQLHVQVQAEDPVERLCIMERLDQLLLKPLTERLTRLESWRLAIIVDDRRLAESVPCVIAGTDVPLSPVASLTAQAFQAAPFAFADGAALFAWLTCADASSSQGAANASLPTTLTTDPGRSPS